MQLDAYNVDPKELIELQDTQKNTITILRRTLEYYFKDRHVTSFSKGEIPQ
jgi:hypothetical protein